MQGLNRKELENYVIDLYHNQKKTFREIQKLVRKSSRDIKAILDKLEPDRSSLSPSSRAYQLFEEGSIPIHVAITLNLREDQVSELYREYWSLNGMYYLNQIYAEIKDDIWSVMELHRRMKVECLSPQQVIRIFKTTSILERKNRDLEGEQARLEVSNKQAAKTFQQFTDSIQVISVNSQPYVAHGLQDTAVIPGHGEVVIRIPFKDFVGKSVYHCHIMFHGDGGMMGVVEVIK